MFGLSWVRFLGWEMWFWVKFTWIELNVNVLNYFDGNRIGLGWVRLGLSYTGLGFSIKTVI